jgi:hypothetical protein
MKTASILVFVLLLSCAVLFAQQPASVSSDGNSGGASSAGPPGSASTIFVIAPPEACPVSLRASQSGTTDLVKVKRGQGQGQDPAPGVLNKPSQRIHLVVAGVPKDSKIIAATVTVRGLSARGRIDKASAGSGSGDLVRTMEITFTTEDNQSLSAELVLPGFTAVKSIKLESLQYSDGSTRNFSGQKLCTISPDPMMLIAGR